MRIRNHFLPIVFMSTISLSASAAVRVVSDIDDTAKITDVRSTSRAVLNGLFSNRAFTGMSDFYSSLKNKNYEFEYVSGSPELLKKRVKIFLSKNHFPTGGIHLKPFTGSGGLKSYKLSALKRIIEKNPNDQFIFIGDDTQYDFQIYDEIYRTIPDRVLAIYIRKVTNRPMPPSVYSFLSAFDIARNEYMMGRLLSSEAETTANSILTEKSDERIMPKFTYCPNFNTPFFMEEQMESWSALIKARVERICRNRHLPSIGA